MTSCKVRMHSEIWRGILTLWISKVGSFRKMGKLLKGKKKVIWLNSKKVKKKGKKKVKKRCLGTMHRKTQVLEMHFLHGCCPRSSPIFFEPMFAWLFVMTVCLTFTNQLWTENNNLTNFGCIQRTKNGNLLNHNPGEDEHISAKTSSKNSVFDLLKFFLWTENNNLANFWCIQSIQNGNLLHSNPA